MGELTSTLDPETKAFADWQVDEFFPMVYPIFNEAYLKVYKTGHAMERVLCRTLDA